MGRTIELIHPIKKDPPWETVVAQDGTLLLLKGSGAPTGIENVFQSSFNKNYVGGIQFGENGNKLLMHNFALYFTSIGLEPVLSTDWFNDGKSAV
jgi:hypothetical protein